MGHYQQSDSLSPDTDVPMSGTGSSTPEGAAGNSDYAAWQWEVVLATALGIAIPDRAEVTGQPWLTIGHDGGSAGSHLIWTAGWNTSANSGATSIQVYLNPALYTVGGAWDRFLNAPAQALSGVPAQNYAGLPMLPPSFESAKVALAGVTTWMETAAQEFGSLQRDASSGPLVGFQGNVADVVVQLLQSLQNVMTDLHDQMTSPMPYSDSIGAAGSSAAQFLVDLLSAHSSWTQLVEHSPLGAVVQVLEEIATRDQNGAYVIPDPQNTPYGDLTVDASWVQLEQQAKNVWMSTLAGGAAGFAGLDLLGRTALSKLVEQFGATTSVIVPVTGPAPPALQPNPVNPNPGPGGPGPGGPGGAPPPGGTKSFTVSPVPPPTANLSVHLGGPGGGPGGGPAVAPPGGNVPPVGFLQVGVSGPGPGSVTSSGRTGLGGTEDFAVTGGPSGTTVRFAGPPAGLPGQIANNAVNHPGGAAGTAAAADFLVMPGVLSGVIGVTEADRAAGRRSEPGAEPPGFAGFTGTIGQPAGERDGGSPASALGRAGRGRKALAAAPLRAPAAGFSLGRDLQGPVLPQSAVPAVAARPPAVTSSVVNVQLVPGSGGTTAGLSSVPGSAVTVPAGGESLPGMSGVIGDGSVLGREVIGTNTAIGADGASGQGGVMMLPPGAMGGMGGAGGAGRAGRERSAYLPQEPSYWGTQPELATAGLGADARDEISEPEFEPAPSRVVGIGAQIESEPGGEAIPDRRMP